MDVLVILASANSFGNTKTAVEDFRKFIAFDVLDLNDYVLHHSYQHDHEDDFLNLITEVLKYKTIVFATPVYWYAMSGVLKVFFDRLTDLLEVHKDLGRQLRNKKMAVLTSSIGDHLAEDFWKPFNATANYLGMDFVGGVHTIVDQNADAELATFAGLIAGRT